MPVSAHLDAGSTSDVNRLPDHQEASGHGTVLVRLQRGDDGQGVGKWRGVAGLGPHDTITSVTPHAIEDTTAKPVAHVIRMVYGDFINQASKNRGDDKKRIEDITVVRGRVLYMFKLSRKRFGNGKTHCIFHTTSAASIVRTEHHTAQSEKPQHISVRVY